MRRRVEVRIFRHKQEGRKGLIWVTSSEKVDPYTEREGELRR